MSQRSLDSEETRDTLAAALRPSGRIDVRPNSSDGGPALSPRVQRRIADAFGAGRGDGVLQLGAGELDTDLDPTLAYWREVGKAVVARVCGALDPTDPKSVVVPEPDPGELTSFAQAAPPMLGAELITPSLLGDVWADVGKALRAEAARSDEGVQGYLKRQSSAWHVVGRVCLHLAENKRDPSFPFAFIATYAHQISKRARPQHRPLGQALQELAGARNRQKLLALLSPLSLAAEGSELIRELVHVTRMRTVGWRRDQAQRRHWRFRRQRCAPGHSRPCCAWHGAPCRTSQNRR